MRPSLAATLASVLTLSALLAVPAPAAAMAGLDPITVLDDDPEDLATGGLAFPANPLMESLDLRGLSLTDDEETVGFHLALGAVGEGYEHPAVYRVSFRHGDVAYHLDLRQASTGGRYHDAYLYRFSEAQQADVWVAWAKADADPASGTLSASFDKSSLVDGDGAAPFPTRVLEGFSVEATMRTLGGSAAATAVDRMPEDGEGSVAYPIRSGPQQTGGLALWTDRPFRSSNGEATTYVYTLTASNAGAAATVRLAADGVPPGWDVRFLQEEVELGAGATVPVEVLATVPFAHTHGMRPSFHVRMADERDPSRMGQVRLGVDYPEVPLPSGHHPDLVFHSREYDNFPVSPSPFTLTSSGGHGGLWMTTLEEDARDEAFAVPGSFSQPDETQVRYGWYVYVPQMSIGLDVDPSQPVQLRVPVSTPLPMPGAVLKADLWYGWMTDDAGWDSTRVATLASDPTDLAAGSSRLFELESLPTAESDRLAPHRVTYFGWSISLTAQRPGADPGGQAPRLEPGGSAHLPLVDYHEAVEEAFAARDGTRLSALGPGTRSVNPGETVLYNLTLRNGGAEGGPFHLALGGEHAPWARLLGGDRVDVPAGEERTVRLAVSAPADAADGQALDLLVEAHGPGGATALLRLGGQVVTATDLADEAALAEGLDDAGRDAPAPAAALLALGLLALAFSRRRV